MMSSKILRATSIAGALLVVTTVAGCGGGSGLDSIAEQVRALNVGDQKIKAGLAELEANVKANRERLLLLGSEIDTTSKKVQTHGEEIAALGKEIEKFAQESQEAKNRQIAYAAKIRFRDNLLESLRKTYAAVQDALNQGLQLRQRQSVDGKLDQQSVQDYTDLGTEWSRLRTAYFATFLNDNLSKQLAPMEALLVEAISEAAKVEPADPQGRATLSKSRQAVVAKIKAMLTPLTAA